MVLDDPELCESLVSGVSMGAPLADVSEPDLRRIRKKTIQRPFSRPISELLQALSASKQRIGSQSKVPSAPYSGSRDLRLKVSSWPKATCEMGREGDLAGIT